MGSSRVPGVSGVRLARRAAGEGALPANASLPQTTAQCLGAGEDIQHGKPLCGGFRISDGTLAGGDGTLGQNQRVDAPKFEFGGEALAVARQIANQPQPRLFLLPGRQGNEPGQKPLRRLRSMIKHDLPRTGSQPGQARGEFRVVDGTAKPAVNARVRVGHTRNLYYLSVTLQCDYLRLVRIFGDGAKAS